MNPSVQLYRILADLTLVLHLSFVLFVVIGQCLIVAGWWARWIWVRNMIFRMIHLCAIGFVVAESWFGIICPLTLLENYFRVLMGEDIYASSFINYWVHKLLFYTAPTWVFLVIYTVFFLTVVVMFFIYPPLWKKSRAK